MSKSGLLMFIVRRLVGLAILLAVLSFIVFSLTYLTPGSAVDVLLGPSRRTPELARAIENKYHLNDPFFSQYWWWVRNALHFNFGDSIQSSLPVSDQISTRMPTSLLLGVYAYILAVLMGVIPGMVAAIRRGSNFDRITTAGSIVALSMPVFVSGVFGLYLFAVVWPIFPVAGGGSGFVDQLWHLTLPAIAMALSIVAFLVRHTRAAMLAVLDQDYVTFARARGLSPRRVMFKYALRNALIPVVTISGPVLAALIIGAVIVETTFSVPGVGSLLVNAIQVKDLPMIQGVSVVFAAIIILMNLLADLTYFAIDPRIRLGQSR
jgi:peptide/nickel transport system permease protein